MSRATKGERISSQLLRVLMIMQALYKQVDGLSVSQISDAIGGKWCDRTIRRDVETLVALGFCIRRETLRREGGYNVRRFWYSISVAGVSDKLQLPSNYRKSVAK
jgi:predicted transcriptional regulator